MERTGARGNLSPSYTLMKEARTEHGDRLRLIPPHGGYRKLRSFQTAEVIYDGTVVFCNRFVDLTNQACYLLKRQLEKLEQVFLQEGGFTERLYAARQQYRSRMR